MKVTTQKKSQDASFSPITIGLHWIMLVLLFATYASVELRHLFDKGTELRDLMKALHFMIGLCVLAMVVVRLAVKMQTTVPPIVPAPPPWQHFMAQLTHLTLYAFMIGMPLLGWATLSALGKPVSFFGLDLPPLIELNKQLGSQLKEIHEVIGIGGYFLIGTHALAAIFHHYVIKDNTFVRMSLKNLAVLRKQRRVAL